MSGDDALARWVAEVQRFEVLASENERVLLERARQGDRTARRRVIGSRLAQATEMALALSPAWMDPLAAIQEANVVLTRIVDDETLNLRSDDLKAAISQHFRAVAQRLSRPWPG